MLRESAATSRSMTVYSWDMRIGQYRTSKQGWRFRTAEGVLPNAEKPPNSTMEASSLLSSELPSARLCNGLHLPYHNQDPHPRCLPDQWWWFHDAQHLDTESASTHAPSATNLTGTLLAAWSTTTFYELTIAWLMMTLVALIPYCLSCMVA